MDKHEHANWRVIYDFGEYWENQGMFPWFHHTLAWFRADITYQIRGKPHSDEAEVVINHDGKINIFNGSWIDADKHYTEFQAKWQDYSLDDDMNLIVQGQGDKLGRYWIMIQPLEQVTKP